MSILIASALAASSPPMTAGQFLSRAEPLLKQSRMILLFSSDARFLMKVVGDAADHARARFEADRAAGRLVAACLPPKGKASVNSTELLAYIRSLPPADRAKSFDAAFAGYAARKYPCRR